MRVYSFLTAAALAAALVGLTGCGSSGPPAYRLSGKVTVNGQPVPLGKVIIDPDVSAGNSGPSGFADIVNGEYDTARSGGKGVPGGPVRVRITGFRKENADPTSGFGPPMFQEYATTLDVPNQNTTKDFDVPAAAAKGLPRNAPPLDP
jgi:hypothetical protein